MKIQVAPRTSGGTMLVTLLMAIIIGVALASYLTLVSAQNRSVMRSLAWNSTIPTLEAGIEEALCQIRYRGVTNLAADGWTASGGSFLKKRDLGSGYYEVAIVPLDPPEIIATGYQLAPLSPAAQIGMILGQVGGVGMNTPQYVKRRVKVTTKNTAAFSHAMLARESIQLNGSNIHTDSFNSMDPTMSDFSVYGTFGVYDPTKAGDKGDVATNSSLEDALNTGNAKIEGEVSTGPGGSVEIGANGSIGSSTWVDGGKKGIESGWADDDANMEIFPTKMPNLNWTTAYSGNTTIGGTNYNYNLDATASGGSYKVTNFKGKIYVKGNVTVYVPYGGTFDLTASSYVYLSPGATLTVYVGAASAKLSGSGISNPGSALNFQYWGLETNTKIDFGGNSSFTGTIYAPEADFKLNGGGGSSLVDFTGASVTKTVTMNGNFNFHYDEALEKIGPNNGYRMSSWNEIDPNG